MITCINAQAIFALLREQNSKHEREMFKSEEDYEAQRHEPCVVDPGTSASESQKKAYGLVQAVKDSQSRNTVLGDESNAQRIKIDEIDKVSQN